MRKIILFLIVFVMIFACTAAFAEDVPVFTLESALEYALLNHGSIASAKAAVLKTETALSEAEYNYKNKDKVEKAFIPGIASTTIDAYLLSTGTLLEKARIENEIAKLELTSAEENVRMNVEKAYWGCLIAEKRVTLCESALNSAKNRLMQTEERIKSGTAAEIDRMTVEISVKSASNEYEKAKRDYEISLLNLKSAMGYDINSPIRIEGSLQVPKKPELSLSEGIKIAQDNDLNIKKTKLSLDFSKLYLDKLRAFYGEKGYSFLKAKEDHEVLSQQFTDTKNAVIINVYSCYNAMLSAYDEFELAELSLKLGERNAEIAKKKYELGMITAQDLEETLNSLDSLKLKRENAVYNIILAVRNYEFATAKH